MGLSAFENVCIALRMAPITDMYRKNAKTASSRGTLFVANPLMLGHTQVRVRQKVSPSSLSMHGASDRSGVSLTGVVGYLELGHSKRTTRKGTSWVEDFFLQAVVNRRTQFDLMSTHVYLEMGDPAGCTVDWPRQCHKMWLYKRWNQSRRRK